MVTQYVIYSMAETQVEESEEELEEAVSNEEEETDKEATDSKANADDLWEETALLEELKTLTEESEPVVEIGNFQGYLITPQMLGKKYRVIFDLKAIKPCNATLIIIDKNDKNAFLRVIQKFMLPGGTLFGSYAVKNMPSLELALKRALELANSFGGDVVYTEKTIVAVKMAKIEKIVYAINGLSPSAPDPAPAPRNTSTVKKITEEIDLFSESDDSEDSDGVEIVEGLKKHYQHHSREDKKQENLRANLKQLSQKEGKLCLSLCDFRCFSDRLHEDNALELMRLQNLLLSLKPPCKLKVRFLERWGSKLILTFKNQATKTMFGDYFKTILENKLNVVAIKGISTMGEPYLEQYVKVEERRNNQQTQRRRNVNNTARFDLSSLDDK
jgi:hypothetical protein